MVVDKLPVLINLFTRLAEPFTERPRFCGDGYDRNIVVFFDDVFLDSVSHHLDVAAETWSFSERLRQTCEQVYQDWQLVYQEKLLQSGYAPETAETLSVAIQAMIEGAYVP